MVLLGCAPATDGAVIWQHVFPRRLNGGNRTFFGLRPFHDLLGTALGMFADVEMIAHEVQKRFSSREAAGQAKSMAIAARLVLFDEMNPVRIFASRLSIRLMISPTDDNSDFLGAGSNHFFENDLQGGFFGAVAIDQGLQRERPLIGAGGGDDCF